MTNPELKRPRGSQYYFVRVVVRGKIQWCNTGMRTAKEAREVCTGAKVGELQQAAAIDILTQDVIQRLTGTQKATFAEAVETWASEMTLSIAPLTLYNYRANILQFLRAHGLMDQPVNPPHRAVINDWVNRGGIGARKSRLRSLQSFFKCLHALGFLFTDPTALAQINLREMVVEERLPRKVLPFTEGEYQRLISSPKASSFWKVLVAFGYWTGLRLRDIVELRWASIREDRLVVFQGKTGQPVELFLSDPAIGSEDLRNAIASLPNNRSGYCFPAERERVTHPSKRAGFSVEFQRLLQAHGIEGKHFHSLRHSCAVRLRALGRTDGEVAGVLGHSNPNSTKTYLDHVESA